MATISALPVFEKDFLQKPVLEEVAYQLNLRLYALRDKLPVAIREDIGALIRSSPEGLSLQGGELQGNLGVVNPGQAMEELAGAITQAMRVEVDPMRVENRKLRGSLTVGLLRKDFSEVLSLPIASFQSEGGHKVDWLDWLLTKGDQIIIAQYRFFRGARERSRTGIGIMAKGRGWNIPSEFRGTAADNFLVRALQEVPRVVERVAREELTR